MMYLALSNPIKMNGGGFMGYVKETSGKLTKIVCAYKSIAVNVCRANANEAYVRYGAQKFLVPTENLM